MNVHPLETLAIVEDESALAHAMATHFANAASAALTERDRFTVALAGGSTPKAAYSLLSHEPFASRLEWSRIEFFFGDERCVPPDHPDSNYRMASETLFRPLGIDERLVFRFKGEDEPHHAAEAYAQLLSERLGQPPVFDLLMLGMGPDGHTASLFPDVELPSPEAITAANFVPHLGAWRLTITPLVIAAAGEVLVATAGAQKASALEHAFSAQAEPQRYPIQLVRKTNGTLTWIVDRAAAAELHAGPGTTPS